MRHRLSSQYSGQLKFPIIFYDKKPSLYNKNHTLEPKSELSYSDIQQKAKQSLLNMEQSELFQIERHNPEINSIRFNARDLKVNSLNDQLNKMPFSPKGQNDEKILFKRSRVKNWRLQTINRQTLAKNIFPIKKAAFHDQKTQIIERIKHKDSSLQLSPSIPRPKLNIFTPKISLATIISTENQANRMRKRAHSCLKPYSLQKVHPNVRVMSVIKFRQDVTLLPKIQREHNKKNYLGYD